MGRLDGKVALITGGARGMGKSHVRHFVAEGARVVFGDVLDDKGAKVAAGLDERSCRYIHHDVTSEADWTAAVALATDTFGRLDVLVNNAGATFKVPVKSPDGFELTFALNHLAYFQLTTSLLDLIRKTPGARVVSTSSSMQARGKLDLQKTPTSLEGSGPGAYATSKLANILFTKELQRRLSGTTATANCFAPGMVRTQFGGFGSDQGFLVNVVYAVAKPFAISPEQGADSLVWLATSPDAASLRGEYVSKRRVVTPQKQALDSKLASDLWALSEDLCAKATAGRP